jgi:Eco57I restriction-modification methylase
VLSIRTAAGLLASADEPPQTARMLASLGITGIPRRLGAEQRTAIGLSSDFRDPQLVAGPGAVRALVGCVAQGPPLREHLSRLAARLQSRAPHVLWLVAIGDGRTSEVALAAWSGEHRPPRVRSLLANRNRIVDSDAETVCALAAAACDDDVLLHLRWTEILGRDALTHRFYRELEQCVSAVADSASHAAPDEDRRTLATLHTSRLLFLQFLQAKGWLDGRRAFLADAFDQCMAGSGAFHRQVLRPLFFGTLNTPYRRRAPRARALGRIPFLNGGLFAPTALERRHRSLHFGDDAFGALIGGLFSRYRFTAREDASTWSDAAVDPEMLGRAFESLMAPGDRHDSGAFFTPQRLVEHVAGTALADLLGRAGLTARAVEELVRGEHPPPGHTSDLCRRLRRLTLLDPACGSGAFLVYALERLSQIRVRLGEPRPLTDLKREIVTHSLFGVDRNPMAVWLCELRLWLSVVIECETADPMRVAPLPNLDRNVRVGDSLSGAGFDDPVIVAGGRSAQLTSLRRRYARATGTRKATLGRALDRGERSRALAAMDRAIAGVQHARREHLLDRRARDLFGNRRGPSAADRDTLAALRTRAGALRRERRRLADGGALPFSFAVHFADIAASGGFDAVIGNPPWIRLHGVPPGERAWLRQSYTVFRHAQWAPGAEAARASSGFASQADLSALFVERGVSLLRPGGALALLVPAKLWRSLAGGGVRRLLAERTDIVRLEDRSDAPAAFDAAVYPSVIVARLREQAPPPRAQPLVGAVQRKTNLVEWEVGQETLGLDDSPGSPWLLLPPKVRAAFDRLSAAGTPLAVSAVGRPLLGVKCGVNDAFVVELLDTRGGVACIRAAGGKTGEIERAMLRPVVRGETTRAWGARPTAEHIIWPCDARGVPLASVPERTARWLARYKRRLLARSDARGTHRWWSVFRTEGAADDKPRVVWADFGRRPRALILPAGNPTIPLNTCYVARCADLTDARTLAAVLNSTVAAAWLHVIAEPARGGFRRYLGWTMARLPLPANWERARRTLAPLVQRFEDQHALDTLPPALLADAVLDVYQLPLGPIAPLLAWSAP